MAALEVFECIAQTYSFDLKSLHALPLGELGFFCITAGIRQHQENERFIAGLSR